MFEAEDLVPVELVLDQMVETGYAGTELGPRGYLGSAEEIRSGLGARNLELVGAFIPLTLSDAARAEGNLEEVSATLDLLEAGQPGEARPTVLLSDAYEVPQRIAAAGRVAEHPEVWLSDERWKILHDQVDRIATLCRQRSFAVAFHPHVGTYVETSAEIERLFSGIDTSLVGWCLDTGHSFFGGSDPLELLRDYGDAMTWIHLKDVHLEVLAELKSDGFGLDEAWKRGIFCPLGRGGVDIDAVLDAVQALGYDRWVVVEQDLLPDTARPTETLRALAKENREYLAARGY